MRLYRYLIFVGLFLCLLGACERDDLCSAGIPKTPNLVLRFLDANITNDFKIVPGLRVVYPEVNDSLPANGGTFANDSIGIPLPTGLGEFTTTIVMVKDAANANLRNSDTVDIRYLAQEVFISKACGFKNEFILQQITLRNDNDNWIRNLLITNDTIQNEFQAAVRIFH
ncbi:MAG: DUF6452 family protein [Flavobacteriaceae bacterium]|nr:DUF6452 family protein [Flavobacteriaceae bacterium]